MLGSAIGMDKIAMKLLLRGAGYPVLDFVWFTREQIKKDRKAVVERVEKEIKYPAFINPAALGSSIGVSARRTARSWSARWMLPRPMTAAFS
ncbi:MAG: hypothetical protein V8Q79_09290 [Christensenellales bacterium]